MKILIDMSLSPGWVKVLATEHEAVHWSTVGDPKAPDHELMAWAKTQGYIVFTNDLDFGAILAATNAEAPSVIQVRTQDLSPVCLGDTLLRLLRNFEQALSDGALIVLDQTRSRIRLLPLNR